MRQAEFERRHGEEWTRFEAWLAARTLRPKRTKGKDKAADAPALLQTADVPAAYRALCGQLALARERRYGPNLVERLNRLVLRGHHELYGAAAPSTEGFLHFVRAGFPAVVRREWRTIALASLLFFGPLFGLILAIQFFPEFASVVVPSDQLREMEQMYSPANAHLGRRAAASAFEMFGFYVWNNVRIGFQTFAGGVLAGLGTLAFLLFNGVFIGAVIGHLTQVGLGPQIWSFVAGHSAFELGAIAVSGAAGLKLGAALLAPGARTRKLALVEEGRIAFRLMGGAALMFFVAAIVEGFWSPLTSVDPLIKYAVGTGNCLLVLCYFLFAGRAGSRSAARAAG